MATQGSFDVLYGNIISLLETYSAAQIASERFDVYDNYMRMFPNDGSVAKVFVYLGDMTPTERAGTTHFQFNWTYNIDLIVRGTGTKGESSYTRADKAAGVRLRILIQQVLTALFTSGNYRLGMSAGQIGSKPLMSLQTLDPSDPRLTEGVLAAARFTLTPELIWEPSLQTGTDLDSIYVTADKWSALIEP